MKNGDRSDPRQPYIWLCKLGVWEMDLLPTAIREIRKIDVLHRWRTIFKIVKVGEINHSSKLVVNCKGCDKNIIPPILRWYRGIGGIDTTIPRRFRSYNKKLF